MRKLFDPRGCRIEYVVKNLWDLDNWSLFFSYYKHTCSWDNKKITVCKSWSIGAIHLEIDVPSLCQARGRWQMPWCPLFSVDSWSRLAFPQLLPCPQWLVFLYVLASSTLHVFQSPTDSSISWYNQYKQSRIKSKNGLLFEFIYVDFQT